MQIVSFKYLVVVKMIFVEIFLISLNESESNTDKIIIEFSLQVRLNSKLHKIALRVT